MFEVELFENNKEESDGVFTCFINSEYRLYFVETCSKYISKSIYNDLTVSIIFDPLFYKDLFFIRNKEILEFLGYKILKKSLKIYLFYKINSVIVDFILQFIKSTHNRSYCRIVEWGGGTLFKK